MTSRTRTLVIGSSGFLGRKLVAAIAEQGGEVHGFDPVSCTQDQLASHCRGSVSDPELLDEALRQSKPQSVISLAAYIQPGLGPGRSAELDPDAAFMVNVGGFRNIIAACRRHGVSRLIWSSSTTVLGSAHQHEREIVDEDAPCFPESVYALTKTLAEEIGTYEHGRQDLEVVAVRPTLVLGRGHPYRGILDPLKSLFDAASGRGGEAVTVEWGPHRFDIVDVRDCAAAILALAMTKKPLRPVYHINAGPTDIHEIVAVAKTCRLSLRVTVNETTGSTHFPLVSAKRLTEDIGFKPEFGGTEIIRDCVT
ncbi:NAD-dependent epimerase/dehydratase family protein [Pseudohoeflea coraliihabitans]|uniref:NAD(P)-dependent oxidoreductase n=1 Tax=Pseudohoeflea coraliihabitans TaxID=2860393 RepID=A0ABS6WJ96_9HYPH|nr:NAD(P)-dependent oxidoreductase [Pseudohoeflea sp. DP4N28-3]MBW3096011.1 NAD(P)-dependent oxidoreductase [Pseudohoeflea sp. DP4N28-3]